MIAIIINFFSFSHKKVHSQTDCIYINITKYNNNLLSKIVIKNIYYP